MFSSLGLLYVDIYRDRTKTRRHQSGDRWQEGKRKRLVDAGTAKRATTGLIPFETSNKRCYTVVLKGSVNKLTKQGMGAGASSESALRAAIVTALHPPSNSQRCVRERDEYLFALLGPDVRQSKRVVNSAQS